MTRFLQPTWSTVPDWDYTLGPEVAELNAEAGFAPDEPQRLILDATFAVKDGRPAAFEIVIVGPRQNIKTGAEKQIAVGWMFLLKRKMVTWSAHEVTTSSASFKDIVDLVEQNDFLARRVTKFYRPEGRERIEFTGGSQLRFKARTKSGGRGLSGDDSILDEAFALKPAHLGALLPVMLTRPHAQVVYGSSAGLADSKMLRSLRDRGRRGDHRLAYFEWGDRRPREGCLLADCDHATIREGCALDDRQRWWDTNPTLGGRITEESLADLRRTLPPEEFARECLGWWDLPGDEKGELALDVESWIACADLSSAAEGRVAFAIDVSPDRGRAAISVGGTRADGRPHVAVIQVGEGTAWIVPRIVELVAKHKPIAVALDAASPAGALIPDLEKARVKLTIPKTRDVVQACGRFYDLVVAGELRHRDEGALNDAVLGAVWRSVGDARAWARKDSRSDITPLYAATLALWAGQAGADYDVLSSIY